MADIDDTPGTSRRRHITRLALFAAVLSVLFYLTAIERVIDVEYVRGLIESTGPLAPLTYVAVSSVLGALLVPGPLLAAGSGFLFGPLLGTFVTLGATIGSAVITAFAGRRAGRDSARALLGADRAARVDGLIRRGGLWAVVGQRWIPGVNDALASYTFGAFGVPLWQMAAGAFIGSAPKAFAYTALGSTLGEFSAPLLTAAIVVWCATAVVGAFAARRGWQRWRSRE
ncbi:TVP38/TMEM64 family protein [Mycobacterium sp. SMC-8]|uniref:TVP38/TMEM64 family protein n=1 Tax=Mycobacterium sp. SMC-8 TaxID=2857060 RepID=UPI0021B3920F|nr:TVP38/TMEM64 family protein [Mycobacterium sp. SMC-8]UXA14551.1 TVP38/TMEM64 family protein [Mycobacterium sp. SMC-8]